MSEEIEEIAKALLERLSSLERAIASLGSSPWADALVSVVTTLLAVIIGFLLSWWQTRLTAKRDASRAADEAKAARSRAAIEITVDWAFRLALSPESEMKPQLIAWSENTGRFANAWFAAENDSDQPVFSWALVKMNEIIQVKRAQRRGEKPNDASVAVALEIRERLSDWLADESRSEWFATEEARSPLSAIPAPTTAPDSGPEGLSGTAGSK